MGFVPEGHEVLDDGAKPTARFTECCLCLHPFPTSVREHRGQGRYPRPDGASNQERGVVTPPATTLARSSANRRGPWRV